ncbi:msr8689 [Mesorhizobium japonicum MAFF 303099]|uniref:Msr8689 protein n=1 Tax=Mesorhizobium japonicum (strain LMG 29417 / CECT 9101 / MAFF 303099) TaxID=266835 RepID=Q98A32_RHILO|nr:msr8689 [Mesorhizobium japonicum MAFF 303099]
MTGTGDSGALIRRAMPSFTNWTTSIASDWLFPIGQLADT